MKRFWRVLFGVGCVGSGVLLVAVAVFLEVGEPDRGSPGVLFLKTPWGVGRVYVEETLHVCWLHPWTGVGAPVWGIRCGQINMNDATQGAAVVGVEREHWIGSVQILSGNIAVRDQIAGGLFGQRVVTNGWAGGAVGLADFVGFAGGGWGGGGDGDVDDVCAVVGGVCGVGIVAGSLGGAAGVACGVEGEEERAGGVLCGVWV